MKKSNYILIVASLGFCSMHAQAPITTSLVNYFSIRSQGANQARHLSGTIDQIYPFNSEGISGTFSVTPEYTQSFDSDQITRCLFGSQLNQCKQITISGSRVAQRGPLDWLADYFYLPPDYQSTISFKPIIDNLIVDFNLFLTLNCWLEGLYINFYAPFVHSRWDLNICENIINNGVQGYIPGYFTPNATPRNMLNNSFIEYANGITKSPVNQTNFGQPFSVAFEPLQFAQLSERRRATSRLADIRAQLGWMYLHEIYAESSIYAHAAFPTGNRPEAKFLFEPMAGNGHHWELGVGVYGRYRVWSNAAETAAFDLQWDAYYACLFNARQKRTFDLVNGPASRYMLAEQLNTPVDNNLSMGNTIATAQISPIQFKSDFSPVANITTLTVDVNSKASGEITLIGIVTCGGLSINGGYNFWIRGCESITPRTGVHLIDQNIQWALKGDAQVWGFISPDQAVALSATQQDATIHSGLNFPPGTTDFTIGERNPNIDNPLPAFGGSPLALLLFQPNVANITANQINSSLPVKVITSQMIDTCPTRTRALSHKVFAHVAYTWECADNWQPYVGVGAEAEFGKKERLQCIPCPALPRCTVSQWGVWFKGGVSFQ